MSGHDFSRANLRDRKVEGFSPCNRLPAGAKAQIFQFTERHD
jgi:hypothetical protein